MMTSSNGNIFRVTGHLCGEFTGPGEFPTQRPGTRSFDVFFDLRLDKRLSKQSWGWWFGTQSRPLWRHCNVLVLNWSSYYLLLNAAPLVCQSKLNCIFYIKNLFTKYFVSMGMWKIPFTTRTIYHIDIAHNASYWPKLCLQLIIITMQK